VRESAADGNTVVYGDASRKEALQAAGLARARAVCVTFNDVPASLKILHHVRVLRPELPVVVRTMDDSNLDVLNAAGATEVVPEVLEGSLMLASHSLLLLGVPLNRVLKLIRSVREERYGLFRGFFHGATDQSDAAENVQPRLHSVLVTEDAAASGKTLASLELSRWVEVTGVRHQGGRARKPEEDYTLEAGDVVVLLGRPDQLSRAEQRLLEG
jgi:CPA2 family monovalent cation:H+ antiporter-2